MRNTKLSHSLLSLMVLSGCGEGQGTVQVTLWGESFIEQGIPASEFEDGWAVTFDTFAVNVGTITAAGQPFPDYQAFDLTQPGPHVVASAQATCGPIDPVSYRIGPVDAGATNVNVDAAIFSEMQASGHAVWISGSATKDGSTIRFAWGFRGETTYSSCEATGAVPDGGTGTTQLTIHGDHLFYESLVDHDAGLRFQALADADVDGDGEVTQAELAAFSGTAFGALDNYDVPPDSNIDNLWDYLAAQIATLGHIDGEGHCH